MQDYLADLLSQMKALGASELFFTKGKAPSYRINGRITTTDAPALTHTKLALLAQPLIPQSRINDFDKHFELSFSHRQAGIGRFRVNLFRQQEELAVVIHALPDHIPSMAELNIPLPMQKVAMLKRGLVLIAGPAGMGKSTTMASLLNFRSEKSASHIITVEEPIEYILNHNQSIINQREIGRDAESYSSALASALCQSPDVIATSNIPDKQVLDHAINFADAGKLFMATINANNSRHAIERLANYFPENKQDQALQTVGSHIKAILAQQLVPTVDGGRVPVYELLLISPRIADLIAQRQFEELSNILDKDDTNGMQTLDQSLYNLFQQKIISAETALEYASSYRNMRLRMRISSAAGSTLSL